MLCFSLQLFKLANLKKTKRCIKIESLQKKRIILFFNNNLPLSVNLFLSLFYITSEREQEAGITNKTSVNNKKKSLFYFKLFEFAYTYETNE